MSLEVPANLPEEVQRIGIVQSVYRPTRKYVVGVYVLAVLMVIYLGIVLVIAGFLVLKPPQKPSELRAAWGLFIGATVFLVAGTVTLTIYWRRIRTRILVCAGGLALWRPGGARVIAWGELIGVRPKITRVYRDGALIGMRCSYVLRRRDGMQLKLTDFYANVEEVGNRAEAELQRRSLPSQPFHDG